MTASGKKEPQPTLLIVAGWAIAIGFTAALIAIRAPRVHTMDPLMPLLIAPVWLVSLTLVSIGTFRLMRFARNMALRNIFTTVAVCAQCFAYGLLLIVLVVYVHLWAGGTL